MDWIEHIPAILEALLAMPWYMSMMIILLPFCILAYLFAKLFKKQESTVNIKAQGDLVLKTENNQIVFSRLSN